MKRVFAFMMALAMVLSLGVTASAEGTGSITITNATIDQTYAPYKIFDASISGGEDGGYIYSIKKTNQFFTTMFGANGTAENTFFTYTPIDDNHGSVAIKAGYDKSALITYLQGLVAGKTPDADAVKATGAVVQFTNLDYGYYVITSTLGTTVTIDSTNPDVTVIDKNQKPGDGFDKLVWDEDTSTWVEDSSANIGDIVDFKVEFNATNYNGDKLIKHYTVSDKKGDALWVEFNDIKVTVNGVSAGKGWYHCTDNDHDPALNTGEWVHAKNSAQWAATANEAGWYLIHNGYDDFDIIIPWLNGYTFTENGDAYVLDYPAEPTSKYSSPVEVVIKYSASVEPNANINNSTSNLFNEAELSWTDDTTHKNPTTETTDMTVHALGVTKTDGATSDLLAGAVFEIYSDAACNVPVYVIPTDVEGVYILDDLNTIVSGTNRQTSRAKYAAYLEAYLGAWYATTQKNVVTTQLNGKLVVLGLEKGTYYLKETEAPAGYNKLSAPVEITINGTTETYTFKTDNDGKVVVESATKTHTYTVTGQVVENNKGMELPSTGGEGTMKMITIGAIVALAFAILLITNKKMTAYQD